MKESDVRIPATNMFLVGMPYAGKSYWGRLIASRYGLHFTDLDEIIAAREARTIPQIFLEKGEAGFRETERKCLKEIVAKTGQGSVIATGGGTPCFYDNMRTMKAAGKVVYLQASPDYLLANYLNSTEKRPLFNDATPVLQQLQQMLETRKPFYEQAHYILQAADISLPNFAEILNHV